MVAVPLVFLVWGLSKKGYFAAVGIPPLILLFYAVFSLNIDPVLTQAQPDFCAPIVNNSTVVENTTSYNSELVCTQVEPVEYSIDPVSLTIINYTMMLGTISILFLISKRLIEKVHKRQPLEE